MTEDRKTARHANEQTSDQARSVPATTPGSPRGAARPALTSEDVRRLTLYKWRYSLESSGFTNDQVGHLLFLKWRYANHAVRG